jgi:hypothetical protein
MPGAFEVWGFYPPFGDVAWAQPYWHRQLRPLMWRAIAFGYPDGHTKQRDTGVWVFTLLEMSMKLREQGPITTLSGSEFDPG